jgi:hypothetical protein
MCTCVYVVYISIYWESDGHKKSREYEHPKADSIVEGDALVRLGTSVQLLSLVYWCMMYDVMIYDVMIYDVWCMI